MNGGRLPGIAVALAVAMLATGCERVMRDMYDQPRLQSGDASPLFRDRLATRPPPPGSIVRAKGDLAVTSSGRRGEDVVEAERVADASAGLPDRPTRAELLRGQERYTIHCLPCHGATGEGDGVVVQRGFPRPPSFHLDRLIGVPDVHLMDVIRRGWGVMPSYADRVAPSDREAIAAYVRVLQLAQRAPVDALPAALRSALATSVQGTTATPDGAPSRGLSRLDHMSAGEPSTPPAVADSAATRGGAR